jgi:MATE family multidrug resistance protein
VIWPTAGLIAHGYTKDAAAIALVIPALVLSCLFYPPDALQVVTAQALRARGDVWVPTLTHLTSYIAVMAPLAWFLAIPQGMGLIGITWAVVIASLLSGGLLLGRFWLLSRRPL